MEKKDNMCFASCATFLVWPLKSNIKKTKYGTLTYMLHFIFCEFRSFSILFGKCNVCRPIRREPTKKGLNTHLFSFKNFFFSIQEIFKFFCTLGSRCTHTEKEVITNKLHFSLKKTKNEDKKREYILRRSIEWFIDEKYKSPAVVCLNSISWTKKKPSHLYTGQLIEYWWN